MKELVLMGAYGDTVMFKSVDGQFEIHNGDEEIYGLDMDDANILLDWLAEYVGEDE